MAVYIAIDTGYDPTKLESQQKVLELADSYCKRDGSKYTAKDIADQTSYPLLMWDLNDAEREEARKGYRTTRGWDYIVHRL